MSTTSDGTMRGTNRPEEPEHPAFQVVDRRHFAGTDGASDAAAEEKPRYPTYVEELMGRLAEVERRFEEKKLEMRDEVARVKNRLDMDLERRLAREKQALLLSFLEVLDNLERALTAADSGCTGLREGVEMTADLFRSRLRAQDIEPIEVLGLPYDPNVGQAVGMAPVGNPDQDGVVVEELLRGYRMGDTLLRPAQVRVGRLAS